MAPRACPCGLPGTYQDCCGRLHRGEAAAATAEQLMRSRFSAFAVGDEAYLLRSWLPSARPAGAVGDRRVKWTRLEVLGSSGGSVVHTEGTVHFRAHYLDRGRPGEMEENSRFVRYEGRWVYAGAL
ncbi:YchJ family metal-binding protein [Nonomuraea fuscirosea]|uniref:YchJ family protein n=1 Tax=Nonomuraea fuscirosea TaxID=1291556 RepID=UPI002DD7C282|nr:YchJ family metal-binding protein [Nonomuraea fuscirosea]WSA55426.1 YchJ family metal-binding protein [Nonomuraea fuscirosea]